jgi:hypothetical protein
MRFDRLYCVAIAVLLILPSTARAETVFVATLDGYQNGYEWVFGTGTGVFILSDDQTELSYEIRYTGLTSNEIFAHIHNAPPRKLGPVVHELPLGTPKYGVWQIPPDMVIALFEEELYVNIHTELFPARSEIRGNIHLQSLPTEFRSWGSIKAHYKR